LGVTPIKISPSEHSEAEAKSNELIKLGREMTIAIGNGNNDCKMLKNAIIGIAILGKEGLASKTLLDSDLVFSNCIDAIHFLMDEKKVIATLRK
jgi:soluble P-type ATPase